MSQYIKEQDGTWTKVGGMEKSFDKYSTEETVIGEWIDGKPIYRKVFELGNVKATSLSVPNIKEVTNLICRRRYDSRANMWVFDANGNLNAFFFSYVTDGIAINTISSDAIIYESTIILEYTKTTD